MPEIPMPVHDLSDDQSIDVICDGIGEYLNQQSSASSVERRREVATKNHSWTGYPIEIGML